MNRTLALRFFLLWLAYLLGGPSLSAIGQAVPVPPPGGFTIQPVKQLRPAPEPPGGLVPYREGDLWGYCDTLGQIWIKPTFAGEPTFFVRGFAQASFQPGYSHSVDDSYWLNARGEFLRSRRKSVVVPAPDGSLRTIRRRRNRTGKELVIIDAVDTLALIEQTPLGHSPQRLGSHIYSIERNQRLGRGFLNPVWRLLPANVQQRLQARATLRGLVDYRGRRLGHKVYDRISSFQNGVAYVERRKKNGDIEVAQIDTTGHRLTPYQPITSDEAALLLSLRGYPSPLADLNEVLAQRLDSTSSQHAPPTYQVSRQANGNWRLLDLQQRPMTRFYPAAQQLVHFHALTGRLLVQAKIHPERSAAPILPVNKKTTFYNNWNYYKDSYLLLDSMGNTLNHVDAVKPPFWKNAPTRYGLTITAFPQRDPLKSANRLDYDPDNYALYYYYYDYQQGRFLPFFLMDLPQELPSGWLFFKQAYQVVKLPSDCSAEQAKGSFLLSPTSAIYVAPTNYEWVVQERSYQSDWFNESSYPKFQHSFPPFKRGVQQVENWKAFNTCNSGYVTRGGRQLYKD